MADLSTKRKLGRIYRGMSREHVAVARHGFRYDPEPGSTIIKLGVDVTVGELAWPIWEVHGVEVAYEAGTGEPDEQWFYAALRAGSNAIVSQDADIGVLCYEAGVRWLEVPNGLKAVEQAYWVLDKLRVWTWIA